MYGPPWYTSPPEDPIAEAAERIVENYSEDEISELLLKWIADDDNARSMFEDWAYNREYGRIQENRR